MGEKNHPNAHVLVQQGNFELNFLGVCIGMQCVLVSVGV